MSEEKNVDTEAGELDEAVIAPEKSSKVVKKKKTALWGIIALACCVVGLVIGLSVGLTTGNNNSSNSSNSSNNSNDSNDGSDSKSKPKPNDPTKPPPPPPQTAALLTDGVIQSASYHKLSFSLRTFGSSSIDTYDSCSALKEDLKSAASIYLESAIAGNAARDPVGKPEPILDDSSPIPEDGNNKSGRPDESKPDDSYDTNNQVKGVDEADIVKSNGKYVFAVYGSEIVVWDAESGLVLSRTDHSKTRPPAIAPSPTSSYRPPSSSSKQPAMAPTNRKLSMVLPRRSVTVNSLLLHKNRLAAIVTKYGNSAGFPRPEMAYEGGAKTSQVIVIYNITEIPTDGISPLQEVLKKDINGTFIEARSIENYAHIVTTTETSIFSLPSSISRYSRDFKELTKDEYLTKVKSFIEEKKLIENFVGDTMEMITKDNKDDCSHVAKLSLFQTSDTDVALPLSMWSGGTIGSYGQITTLDMLADGNTDGGSSGRRLNNANSVTGFFLPNSFGTKVYASQNHMVLATNGNSFSKKGSTLGQYTFFRIFTLSNDGTRAQGKGVGKAPGNVLNQFSIDEWDGHLRVATTVRSTLACKMGSQRPPPPSNDRNDRNDRNNRNNTNNTNNEKPPRPSDNIPTRACRWEQVPETDNMITILKIPDSSSKQMNETSSIKGLGLPGERIYSVRFMEEKAFMVTFRRTDPFYTFDLTDHTDPQMKGELKISGFSNYLHPFDSDGNIMIAVGQNANETTGRTTGLQISLYNVTDLANPTAIDRYNVQQGDSTYSWSEAQYNHKAFRFYENSNKLIIPTKAGGRNAQSFFDGFKVFSVSLSGISSHFDIQHNFQQKCWSDATFSARSLIHSGILTTMKGHTVKAHNIDTKDFHWLINMDSNTTSC